MRNWSTWAACALLLLATAAGAADIPPPPSVTQRRAVSVADLGITARIAVDRIKIAMLPGDELGNTSQGMFCVGRKPLRATQDFIKGYGTYETSVAVQLLKRLGYPMAIPGSTNAFEADVAAAPDFRLGGILKELRMETCRNGNDAEGWIYLKVDWALYSEKEQKVVFQQTTEGLARSEQKTSQLFQQAVVSTIEYFVAAPEFNAAIQPDAAARLAAWAPAAAGSAPAPRPAVRAEVDRQQPPAVEQQTALSATGQDLAVKIAVDPAKVALLPGDEIGRMALGTFCSGQSPLNANDTFLKTYGGFVATVAQQTLRKNGFPLALLQKTSAFDTEQASPPDFRLGGVVRSVRMALCQTGNNAEGWIHVKIDWALYAEKSKAVVLRRSTEGLARSSEKVPDLPTRAVVSAVENLLAAPELLAALKTAPPAAETLAAAAAASAASGAAASGPLRLAGGTLLPGGAAKNQARLRAAVVTLETAAGRGSGFYIDREGYLLTDFHVVNGAKFVKVSLLNGDKLVAQVVKVSPRDDVALLKSMPVDLDPLPIRPDALDVGEDVFAIGTPLGVLTSTMTRGVLSADRVSQGVHLLQSDAAVTFGSSGGPLLDGEGRVIGLTRSGMPGEKAFNFFIPVQDALRVLDVSIGAPR